MIQRKQAIRVLSRLMKSGVIERMPKKASDAKLLLALAATSLLPRQRYSESEINDHLMEWLAGFTCPIGLDFVTVRRYLVDYGFVMRDPSGSYYLMNGPVTASYLDDDARTLNPRDVFADVQRDRAERRRRHGTR